MKRKHGTAGLPESAHRTSRCSRKVYEYQHFFVKPRTRTPRSSPSRPSRPAASAPAAAPRILPVAPEARRVLSQLRRHRPPAEVPVQPPHRRELVRLQLRVRQLHQLPWRDLPPRLDVVRVQRLELLQNEVGDLGRAGRVEVRVPAPTRRSSMLACANAEGGCANAQGEYQ